MAHRHDWLPTDFGRAAICINCELVISADILTQELYPQTCAFQECCNKDPHRLDLTSTGIVCRHCAVTIAELLERLSARPVATQGRRR